MEQPELIGLTPQQLAEFAAAISDNILSGLGISRAKTPVNTNGKIYRADMEKIIKRRAFENAVNSGLLKVHKENPAVKNSRVYATLADWNNYLKYHTQHK